MIIYYKYKSSHKGERYFKVNGWKDVIQIITLNQRKRGRPYHTGITKIKCPTFILNYGPRPFRNPAGLKKISKKEYEQQFNKMVKKLAA